MRLLHAHGCCTRESTATLWSSFLFFPLILLSIMASCNNQSLWRISASMNCLRTRSLSSVYTEPYNQTWIYQQTECCLRLTAEGCLKYRLILEPNSWYNLKPKEKKYGYKEIWCTYHGTSYKCKLVKYLLFFRLQNLMSSSWARLSDL